MEKGKKCLNSESASKLVMATESITAVWKEGKIIPLKNVDLEEDTVLTITIPVRKKPKRDIMSLAGVWKDDDETYNTFGGIYKNRGKFRLRQWRHA